MNYLSGSDRRRLWDEAVGEMQPEFAAASAQFAADAEIERVAQEAYDLREGWVAYLQPFLDDTFYPLLLTTSDHNLSNSFIRAALFRDSISEQGPLQLDKVAIISDDETIWHPDNSPHRKVTQYGSHLHSTAGDLVINISDPNNISTLPSILILTQLEKVASWDHKDRLYLSDALLHVGRLQLRVIATISDSALRQFSHDFPGIVNLFENKASL